MDIVTWLIVGLVAGVLAGLVVGGYGILADIVVGIIGAFIGGWLFTRMGWHAPFAGLAGAQGPRRLHAVHHRHAAIHEHQVIVGGGQRLQGLGAVARHVGLQAQPLQHGPGHHLVHRIVLRRQDAQRPSRGQALLRRLRHRRGLHRRLAGLTRGHERGLERVRNALSEPRRVVDLFSALFKRPIEGEMLGLATGECLANLNYLMSRGVVRRREDEAGVSWYALA